MIVILKLAQVQLLFQLVLLQHSLASLAIEVAGHRALDAHAANC
jgi:hypothetical protein